MKLYAIYIIETNSKGIQSYYFSTRIHKNVFTLMKEFNEHRNEIINEVETASESVQSLHHTYSIKANEHDYFHVVYEETNKSIILNIHTFELEEPYA
jgi:hypothetical protein